MIHQKTVRKLNARRHAENKYMHEAERDMGVWFWVVLGIIALLIIWVPR